MPDIIMTDCPDCGCGSQQCAQIAVTCGCCGHTQFVNGDPAVIQAQFYNYELSCAFCGVTWQGHTVDLDACPDPFGDPSTGLIQNVFWSLGSDTYYRYIGAYSRWYITPYLEYAIQHRAIGQIYDNCGNQIDISQQN